jgi:hypothetical protein
MNDDDDLEDHKYQIFVSNGSALVLEMINIQQKMLLENKEI